MVPIDLLPAFALFALVVRHQSFTRAAAEGGLPRSVVSDRIRRLEATLGTQLLRRTTRRVTPTEAGLVLYAACAPLLEQAGKIAAGASEGSEGGLVRVNAPPELLQAGLAALLVELAEGWPELSLELASESRLVDLQETRADVVVRLGATPPGSAVVRRLGRTRVVVVASPGYLARAGTPRVPEELLGHACLHYAPVPVEREFRFESPRGAFPVTVKPRLSSDDGGLLKRWALESRGVAVFPEVTVARELEAGALVRLLPESRRDVLDCWAILPAGRLTPRPARRLVDLVARRFPSLPGVR